MNKTVVYTSIINNYDTLKDPKVVNPNYDYVCISDNDKIVSGTIWNFRKTEQSGRGLCPSKHNRFHKMFPNLYFPKYERSLYVDGAILITNNLEDLIEHSLGENNIAFRNHSQRDCAYKEAEGCKKIGKDIADIIDLQISRYRKDNYPENLGLIDGSAILRRHNDPEVISLMKNWWFEISRGSRRDQISFNYVAWKSGILVSEIENITGHKALFTGFHNPDRNK